MIQKSDVFQDRKCIYPNKWIFFIKPPHGSECKAIMSFSKLRELFFFLNSWSVSAQWWGIQQMDGAEGTGRAASASRARDCSARTLTTGTGAVSPVNP